MVTGLLTGFFHTNQEELEEIQKPIAYCKNSRHPTMGVSCKKQQATFVYSQVKAPSVYFCGPQKVLRLKKA